jgi:hypothetical protein
MAQSFIASGDHILDGLRIGIESGRTFSGIQGGQPSTAARTRVNKPSPIANCLGNGINGTRDLRQSALHGGGHFLVFLVDDAGNFKGGEGV